MRLVAVTVVYWVVIFLIWFFTVGADMAQAVVPPQRLNQMLSEYMGTPIRVGYNKPHKLSGALAAHGGVSNVHNGRVWLPRNDYQMIRNFLDGDYSNPRSATALGILAHELGHFSPEAREYRGTPNGTGGLDMNQAIPEGYADKWAYKNMRALLGSLGLAPPAAKLWAARAVKAQKRFRQENPY